MDKTPTIAVRGVGQMSVAPDRAVISFDISSLDMDYARSVNALNERVAALRTRLEKAGIKASNLKTTRYGIDAQHETRGKDENRRNVFVGWLTRHHMRLELPLDRELLNKAFDVIASDGVLSSIKIGFEVSDQGTLRTKLLEDATRVATRNAEAIAAAAGCKLGRALKIKYDWSELRIGSMNYEVSDRLLVRGLRHTPDLEPDDLKAQDSVRILFELL